MIHNTLIPGMQEYDFKFKVSAQHNCYVPVNQNQKCEVLVISSSPILSKVGLHAMLDTEGMVGDSTG